jgi:hypothetical protein
MARRDAANASVVGSACFSPLVCYLLALRPPGFSWATWTIIICFVIDDAVISMEGMIRWRALGLLTLQPIATKHTLRRAYQNRAGEGRPVELGGSSPRKPIIAVQFFDIERGTRGKADGSCSVRFAWRLIGWHPKWFFTLGSITINSGLEPPRMRLNSVLVQQEISLIPILLPEGERVRASDDTELRQCLSEEAMATAAKAR